MGDAPGDATSPKTPRERVEVEQVTARVSGGEGPRRTRMASSSTGGERKQSNVVRSEGIQIHAPSTSIIITSAPITMVASGALTTATMVTPSCSTRPTAGVTRALLAMRYVPNVMLPPELGTHLKGEQTRSRARVNGSVGLESWMMRMQSEQSKRKPTWPGRKLRADRRRGCD